MRIRKEGKKYNYKRAKNRKMGKWKKGWKDKLELGRKGRGSGLQGAGWGKRWSLDHCLKV